MEVHQKAIDVLFPKYKILFERPIEKPNQQLQSFIKNQLPQLINVLQNLQSLYNRMLTTHGALILKKQSHQSLFQSFLRRVSEKVEKYFQKVQDSILKQSQQNEHFDFQNIRTQFRERLESLQSDLVSKFLKNKTIDRKKQEKITQSLYLLLQYYQFTKSEINQIIGKYKVKSGIVISQVVGQLTPSFVNTLIFFDPQFKQSVEQYVRKKFGPFWQKRDFLASKVRDVLKQTQSKVSIDNKMYLKAIISKQYLRSEKDIFNCIQKEIKNKQISKTYEDEIPDINQQVTQLKSQFHKIKNTPYYLDIIKGNFIETYQIQTKKLENIFFMGRLEKYLQEVLSFVQRIKNLISRMVQNRKNEKQELGYILDQCIKNATQNLEIATQGGPSLRDLINYQFSNLSNLISDIDYEQQADPLQRYKEQQKRREQERKYKNTLDRQKKQEEARKRKQQMQIRAEEQKRLREQKKRKDQEKKIKDQEERRRRQQERKAQQAERIKKMQQQKKEKQQKRRIEDQKRRIEEQKRKTQKQKQDQQRRIREEQQRKRRDQERKAEEAERIRKLQIQKQKMQQEKRQRQQKKRIEEEERRIKQQNQQKKKQQQLIKLRQIQQKRKQEIQKQKQLQQKKKQEQLQRQRELDQKKRREQEQKRKIQEKKKLQQKQKEEEKRRRQDEDKKRKQQDQKKRLQEIQRQKQQERKRLQQQKQLQEKKKRQEQQKRKLEQKKRLQQQKLAQQKRRQEQQRQNEQKRRQQQQRQAQQKRRQEQQRLVQEKRKQQAQQKRRQQEQLRQKQLQQKKRQQQQRKKQQQKRKQQQQRLIQQKKRQEQLLKQKEIEQKKRQEEQKRRQQQEKRRQEEQKKKAEQKKRLQQQKKAEQLKKIQEQKKLQEKKKKEQEQKKKKEQEEKIKNSKAGPKGKVDNRNFNYEDMYDDDQDIVDQDVPKTKPQPKKPEPNKKKDDDFQFLNDDVDFGDDHNQQQQGESRIKYEDDFQQQGQPEEEAQNIQTKELISAQNIKLFNDYLKGSGYVRKNKVNLQPFNDFSHFISIFEEFIQNREIYLFESEIGQHIFQVSQKYQDMQTYQQQASEILQFMQKNYYDNVQSTQFDMQTRYFFPIDFENQFGIKIIQFLPAYTHFVIFLDKPLRQDEDLMNAYSALIQTFTLIFEVQLQEDQSPKINYVVLSPQNLQILNTFDKSLPNMLIMFNYLYQYKGKSTIQIDQYTIDRFFYASHSLSPLYQTIQNQEQTLNKFFENQNNKFQTDKMIKTVYHQFTTADPSFANKIFSSFKSDKENFMKASVNSILHLFELERVDQQQNFIGKIAIYIEMTKSNPKPLLNIYLFNSDPQSAENNQRIYQILMTEEESRFETTTYMDYTRHNGLYQYSGWSLPLWAHIATKKKMKPSDALAVLSFSMFPYYAAFKVQD